jgi:hypothetical protein
MECLRRSSTSSNATCVKPNHQIREGARHDVRKSTLLIGYAEDDGAGAATAVGLDESHENRIRGPLSKHIVRGVKA